MTQRAVRADITCWEALGGLIDDPATRARTRTALKKFRDLIEDLRKVATDRPLPQLVEAMYRSSGIVERYTKEDTFEARGRLENLGELKNSTADHVEAVPPAGLVNFLDRVSLIADTDALPEGVVDDGKVALMTVHAAKGLEFPVVLVVGMDEDVFPHIRANEADADLQEERRLAYVAITRAEEKLYLLRARRRRFGGTFRDMDESRFLRLIPADLMDGDPLFSRRIRAGAKSRSRPEVAGDSYVVYDDAAAPGASPFRSRFERAGAAPSRRPPSPPSPGFAGQSEEPHVVLDSGDDLAELIKVGTRVLHPRFGEGEIRELEGSPANLRARIFFRRGGQRLVYLASANLEIISR